ncbi:virulence factor SrfB, partial [Thiocapsa sp.]|uniref:virulence factor SrfB n=1 Tax=Thiocapsa sp. TaxID=2024551 RepID=UPI0025F8FD6F
MNFETKVTLIADSGVQFLDFGLTLALRKALPGEFVVQESNRSLARLLYDERTNQLYWPDRPGIPLKSQLSVPVDDSARLLDGIWLPVPVLRLHPPRRFASGPETWARLRLLALSTEEAASTDHTHRLTLAIDTNLLADAEDLRYLAPTEADVGAGAAFAFAHRAHEIGWFPELPWVAGWIQEVFDERAGPRLRLPPEDVEAERERLAHHAHYLNLLAVIGEAGCIPEIKLLGNKATDVQPAVPVDMVLDVGNSRTCG